MSNPSLQATIVRSRAGGDIYVERQGSGPVLVWVGGLGDDHTGWVTQVEQFSDTFTCVTFDNRATGKSTVLPGPYTMQDFADDAHDVVTALDLGPVTAIGSSMGGAICQRWAIAYEQDIERLVLAGTWAEKDPLLTVLLRHWTQLGQARQEQRLIESLFLGCYSGPYLRENPAVVEEFLATPLPDLDGLMAAIAACLDHDALDELLTVNVPSLVIAGTLDTVARTDLPSRIAERLPNADFQEIVSGHMMIWERPEEFERAVRGFLNASVEA